MEAPVLTIGTVDGNKENVSIKILKIVSNDEMLGNEQKKRLRYDDQNTRRNSDP